MTPTDITSQLLRDEGLRLYPYTDTVGKLTIGVGHNLTDKGISQEEAMSLLAKDVAEVESELARTLPVALLQTIDAVRFAVLINLAFNMGVPGLLKFHNTLTLATQKNYAGAAEAMLESLWAKQVGARAQRLAAQMRDGVWR